MADTELDELVKGTISDLRGPLGQLVWAEEEIAAAQERHPECAAQLWRGFRLVIPTHALMDTEFVYRSHARELLERVAAGQDTRPGTWAEIVCICYGVSIKIPLHGALGGLYFRAWERAFPEQPVHLDRGHHEGLYSSEIDELESNTRRKLSVSDRRLSGGAA
jgi:hypothetical protein